MGEHANLLKSFLNALLPLSADGQIDSLEYLTPEQVPEIPGLPKYSIVDVKCTDQKGRIFIGLEFVFIELPKFKPSGRSEKRLQTLWLRFLREVGSEAGQVIDPALTQERDIAAAIDLVEQSAFTEAELNGYHVAQDRARMAVDLLADAKAKGKAEGEHAKARSIAAALQAEGMSLERIAALTGLSMEYLREALRTGVNRKKPKESQKKLARSARKV